jgi:hypothetical protein
MEQETKVEIQVEMCVTKIKLNTEQISKLVAAVRNIGGRLLTLKEILNGFKVEDKKLNLDWTWTSDHTSIGRCCINVQNQMVNFVGDENLTFVAWAVFVGYEDIESTIKAALDKIRSEDK